MAFRNLYTCTLMLDYLNVTQHFVALVMISQEQYRRRLEPCAGRAAADNLWAPPPTFVDRRAAADNLSARRRYHCCCEVILLEFSMTSSLSSLPSGRSRPPIVSCFSMLSFFLKFDVFLAHHPVQKFFLGLLLPHLQSILPSIFLFEVSPLSLCPIQFRCLDLIIVNRDLSSSTSFNTSFDVFSVQLIFSILRHTFISKASNLVMSSFLIVLISAQYKVTLQISVFNILFLRHLHSSQSSPW